MSLPDFRIDGAVIVTGASRGIGAAVCTELAGRGALIVAIARSREHLEATVCNLPGEGHEAIDMDVTDPDSWPRAISATGTAPIRAVITAAAMLEPIGTLDQIDPGDFLRTLQANVLGTMLAIRASLPALRESGGSVVTFSGGGATKPLPRYDAYAASKAAVVRLTENVAAAEPAIRANAVAPGFVATSMHEATLNAGAERAGSAYIEETRRQLDDGGVPAERSAELVATLVGPLGEGITGKLISAQWDPFDDESFHERLRAEPDLCTLRRIDDVFFAARTGDDV